MKEEVEAPETRDRRWITKLLGLNKRYPWARYVIVGAGILSMSLFVGESNIINYVRNQHRRQVIQREYNEYLPHYVADSTRLSEIRENPEYINRIARERYYMHQPGEEVFVLRPDSATAGSAH